MFTLVAIAVIGYMFFVLSPEMFDRERMAAYYTELPDAGGVQARTQVKTNGVIVGKVRKVELGANITKVIMEVQASVGIPVGSTIEIKTRGLLGDVYLEIVRIEDTGQYIPDGGMIPRSSSGADMSSVMASVGSIATDVKKITATLSNVIGTKDSESKLQNIVDDIEGITSTLRGTLTENRSDLRQVMANLREVSQGIKEVMSDDNRERLDRILASFDTSMEEVKGATRNIKLISEKVERGEGTLGRLVNDETTLNEIEGAIKDLRDVISPVNKLQITVDYHGEVRRETGVQNYFNLMFRTQPDRYYLIGATDKDDEVTDTTTETFENTPATGDDPAKVRTRETTRTSKQLAFNLQFAKRWYNVALRFGLFESTGGFGGDIYFFRDRMRMAVEAFDWKSRDNAQRRVAHLKAYASVLFFNHISAMAGVDDITRLDQNTGKPLATPNYFVGAGLSFNDQDIKALFGAAAFAR